MTKEEVLRLEKIVSRNLRALSKMVSKDLGIRFPRPRFITHIDVDNKSTGELVYWLYLKPKNKAIERKCRRNKLLSAVFEDVTMDAFCYFFKEDTAMVSFNLKITNGTTHTKLYAGLYEITFDENEGEGFTTRSIRRI